VNIRSNISEKGKEICVTAELPGLTEEDVSVTGDRIVIEGRKKSEQEKKARREWPRIRPSPAGVSADDDTAVPDRPRRRRCGHQK